MAPAEPRRAKCGHGPHPREAKHARPRAAVRCVLRKPANSLEANGAARDQLTPMCTEKSSPASCAPVSRTERQFAPRDRARPVRQGCCPLARLVIHFQTFTVAQQGLQRLALRRVQACCRACPKNVSMSFSSSCCASCSGLFVRRGIPMLQPLGVATAPDSVYPPISERLHVGASEVDEVAPHMHPAIGEHEVIRQLPDQLLVSGAHTRYTGSSTPRPPNNFCAAAALREGSTIILTAFWQTQSQLRGFSPSSPRA